MIVKLKENEKGITIILKWIFLCCRVKINELLLAFLIEPSLYYYTLR